MIWLGNQEISKHLTCSLCSNTPCYSKRTLLNPNSFIWWSSHFENSEHLFTEKQQRTTKPLSPWERTYNLKGFLSSPLLLLLRYNVYMAGLMLFLLQSPSTGQRACSYFVHRDMTWTWRGFFRSFLESESL